MKFIHHQNKKKREDQEKGQAMIIAILTLSGAILGATALAGLLTLYQIRATTDSADSAKAIFAADAGLNWALYSFFQPPAGPMPGSPIQGSETTSVLGNGATVNVVCSDASGNPTACDAPTTVSAISEGDANGSRRAFDIDLTGSTSTLP